MDRTIVLLKVILRKYGRYAAGGADQYPGFDSLYAGQEDLKLINNVFMNVIFWYNKIA